MEPAVIVEGLRKDYGTLRAVDDLSFTIAEGEILALLGPNGAGKTTTVEILEGHRERTAGNVSVLGYDPATGGRAYRERIGIVLQEAGFDEDFTPRELIELQRRMYPRRLGVDDVIELVGLQDKADVRVKTLSGGQRRRLDLGLGPSATRTSCSSTSRRRASTPAPDARPGSWSRTSAGSARRSS